VIQQKQRKYQSRDTRSPEKISGEKLCSSRDWQSRKSCKLQQDRRESGRSVRSDKMICRSAGYRIFQSVEKIYGNQRQHGTDKMQSSGICYTARHITQQRTKTSTRISIF